MRNRRILALWITALLCLVSVSAHPGRTDKNGGHYNHSTGEYHYHHGYPAHQHIDGVCPYDYDDRTGWNSGSSGQEKGLYYLDGTPVERENETKPKPEPAEDKKDQTGGLIAFWSAVFIFFVWPMLSAIAEWISWYREKRNQQTPPAP